MCLYTHTLYNDSSTQLHLQTSLFTKFIVTIYLLLKSNPWAFMSYIGYNEGFRSSMVYLNPNFTFSHITSKIIKK